MRRRLSLLVSKSLGIGGKHLAAAEIAGPSFSAPRRVTRAPRRSRRHAAEEAA
jgi:hypothetical protein